MANTTWYRGLRSIKNPGGDTPRINYYKVSSAASTIGVGTPMRISTNGYAYALAATTLATQIASPSSILGVSAEYKKTGTATRLVGIWDDPNQLFAIKCGMTTAMSLALLGTRARIKTPKGVNTTSGLSKACADTLGTVDGALHVMGIDRAIDNEVAAYADLVVKINPRGHVWGGVRATGV